MPLYVYYICVLYIIFVSCIYAFAGSSSALNLVAACRVARSLPPHSVIVTIVCDSGLRHLSRFWNKGFIENTANSGSTANGLKPLVWPSACVVPACLIGSMEDEGYVAS